MAGSEKAAAWLPHSEGRQAVLEDCAFGMHWPRCPILGILIPARLRDFSVPFGHGRRERLEIALHSKPPIDGGADAWRASTIVINPISG